MKNYTLEELKLSEPVKISESRYLLPSWTDSRGEVGGYLYASYEDAIQGKAQSIDEMEYKAKIEERYKQEKEEEEKAEFQKLNLIRVFLARVL